MALDTGIKLGRYEIRSRLGAGGMGEVYLSLVIGRNVGIAHIAKGDANAASAQLKKTIELDPTWWGGHHWLGIAYLKFGRREEATGARLTAFFAPPGTPPRPSLTTKRRR